MHLAADLEKAAERFETNAGEQVKALATLHETLDVEASTAKAEQKPAAFQPQPQVLSPKAIAEQKPAASQPQVQSAKAIAEQTDKGNNTRKG
jgi:hypothetical protein